jgi:hypothetical protein
VLIAPGRAWLIDWAWPTLGAAWIDPACWLLRLIAAGGHTPAEAERQAARLPPFADADPAHIALFARASTRLWEEIAQANCSAWTRRMAQSAHDWSAHRRASLLRKRTARLACRHANDQPPEACFVATGDTHPASTLPLGLLGYAEPFQANYALVAITARRHPKLN